MKHLCGRIAMVTGAASGIGKATAQALADEGCHLVICDIQEEALEQVAEELRSRGREVLARRCDVSREPDMKRLAQASFKKFGKVDIAMSNAGTAVGGQSHLLDRKHWSRVLGVNLWGAIHTLIHFVRPMVERKEGHWVVTASGMGLVGMPYMATYATSKFALVGLTECVRAELSVHNVGVTTLCPAVVRTPIFENVELIGFQDRMRNMVHITGGMSPEKFARKVVQGIKKNKGFMMFSGLTRVTYGLKRLSPYLYEKNLKQFARLARHLQE
jgi:NAD(P)-dependent dehydrogenase (short-subunit alcohol dehydrogenase family)